MRLLRDFTYYRPDEKRGIVVLCVLIVLVLGAIVAMQLVRPDPSVNPPDTEAIAFAERLQREADSVAAARSQRIYRPRDTVYVYRNRDYTYTRRDRRSWQRDTTAARRDTTSLFLPRPAYDRIEKYAEGTVVDLNRADTTELKKIPGIGSAIASLIVGYRNSLGGYYKIGQLREINLDDERLASWFSIDTTAIVRIDVNRSSVERLRNHPYINFYQAKALVEYRRKNGALHSLKPFVLYEEFTAEDFDRLSHYLQFAE